MLASSVACLPAPPPFWHFLNEGGSLACLPAWQWAPGIEHFAASLVEKSREGQRLNIFQKMTFMVHGRVCSTSKRILPLPRTWLDPAWFFCRSMYARVSVSVRVSTLKEPFLSQDGAAVGCGEQPEIKKKTSSKGGFLHSSCYITKHSEIPTLSHKSKRKIR